MKPKSQLRISSTSFYLIRYIPFSESVLANVWTPATCRGCKEQRQYMTRALPPTRGPGRITLPEVSQMQMIFSLTPPHSAAHGTAVMCDRLMSTSEDSKEKESRNLKHTHTETLKNKTKLKTQWNCDSGLTFKKPTTTIYSNMCQGNRTIFVLLCALLYILPWEQFFRELYVNILLLYFSLSL